MSVSVPESVRAALAEALRERLMQRDTVRVPGLGRFRLHHEPSRVVVDDGRRTLLPPADQIAFEPEPSPTPA